MANKKNTKRYLLTRRRLRSAEKAILALMRQYKASQDVTNEIAKRLHKARTKLWKAQAAHYEAGGTIE